ncbi:MAG: YIP1 family protein [Proteobacteria bacterium]|nr:YIP1 family protein [Pseudomonadota bacterium]
MAEIDSPHSNKTEPSGPLNTAINILTSPSEAFIELEQRPTKLIPIAVILISTMAVMFWYFTIIDFDWYIDDALSIANLNENQLEQAREAMQSMSQTTFKMFGVLGGSISLLVVWVLQAGYLSLVSALQGDRFKFTHWFSLIVWTGLPYLISVIGMAVTVALSPNGQLSAYALDPTTLANLGMQSSNGSVQTIMNALNLTMLWSIALTVLAYRQWLESSWARALGIVLAPYLLILGTWAYFALT